MHTSLTELTVVKKAGAGSQGRFGFYSLLIEWFKAGETTWSKCVVLIGHFYNLREVKVKGSVLGTKLLHYLGSFICDLGMGIWVWST